MSEQEMEVMKNTLGVVKSIAHSDMEQEKEDTQEVNEQKEGEKDEEDAISADINKSDIGIDFNLFLDQDEVEDEVLPLETKSHISRSSIRSKASSAQISQLESKISKEREERLKMQKEIDEMKRINQQLVEQLKSK